MHIKVITGKGYRSIERPWKSHYVTCNNNNNNAPRERIWCLNSVRLVILLHPMFAHHCFFVGFENGENDVVRIPIWIILFFLLRHGHVPIQNAFSHKLNIEWGLHSRARLKMSLCKDRGAWFVSETVLVTTASLSLLLCAFVLIFSLFFFFTVFRCASL